MTHLIDGPTATQAWLCALDYLCTRPGRQEFGLIVDVADPRPEHADQCVVAELDEQLRHKGLQDTTAVANTLFPQALAKTSASRDVLYRRYGGILPQIHRNGKNRKGTYFERLVCYPDPDRDRPVNQIERIISDLQTEVGHRQNARGALRHIYEAEILVPARDHRPRGFPCLTCLSFHLDREQLRLTAVYRNQYYIEKALGNFLGLAGLQLFVAEEAGLVLGPLTVHACHAEIEPGFGLRDVDKLIRQRRGSTEPQHVVA